MATVAAAAIGPEARRTEDSVCSTCPRAATSLPLGASARYARGVPRLARTCVVVTALLAGCSPSAAPADPLPAADAGPDVGSLFDAALDSLDQACDSLPFEDRDGDGYTKHDGDCNDCDANINPGAYDVDANLRDEDCTGVADDAVHVCDQGLAVAAADAADGARALGLCQFVDEAATGTAKRWGVVSARYTLADGTDGMADLSHGVLDDFGPYVHVQEGSRLLALSTGPARRPSDSGYDDPSQSDMGTTGPAPAGFPLDAEGFCPGVHAAGGPANDAAALELRLRVPTNAHAVSFDFAFFTAEFPDYVCSAYDDSFVALLDSSAPNPRAKSGNVSFDDLGDPISVNNALLDVCKAGYAHGKSFVCLRGTAQLVGNGFGVDAPGATVGRAATGWLRTTAPVTPGEVATLRLAVWDAGDHLRTSTVIVDNLTWTADPASASSTAHIDNPK